MAPASPSLRIGLPVYNGAATVVSAIESLLAQTRGDFELLISDNASTDATGELCREFAKRDARIRYVRHPVNVGAMNNFGSVLDHTDAPFFMWAACDDTWLPTFVERNLAALDADPTVVCSVSRVEFFDPSGERIATVGPDHQKHELAGGTYPLDDTPSANLLRFLENPECNSRFYGIHRTDVIRRCYSPNERYLASDWVVMARTLGFGRHHEVPDVLMRRGSRGASSDVTKLILSMNPSWISRRYYPMLPMTRRLLLSRHVPIAWFDFAHLRRLREILWMKNVNEYRHHQAQLALGR
jgi:glycosyltransferase involved in cell wall biosynthesis